MHKYFPELVDKFLKTLLLSLFGYHFLPDTDSWKTNFFAEPKSSRYDSLTKLSRWKIPWSTALFTLDHFGLRWITLELLWITDFTQQAKAFL